MSKKDVNFLNQNLCMTSCADVFQFSTFPSVVPCESMCTSASWPFSNPNNFFHAIYPSFHVPYLLFNTLLLSLLLLLLLLLLLFYFFEGFLHQRQLVVFRWNLSDKSFQVSRALLSILAVLNNVVVWMISTRSLTSKSSSPFSNPFVTVPVTIGIIVTSYSLQVFHTGKNSWF